MTIESIAPVGDSAIAPTRINASANRADFGAWVGDALSQVGQSLQVADGNLRALAAGQDVPVHEVMISLEQARMDLTLATEVRNRLVEAYQELTRMQL
jgi:flagellar hook-basal body complex protein FliE